MKDLAEWAKLIWSEYEYRHGLYWKSIYLWGGAAVALFVAPFLQPEVKELGSAAFIFPILGSFFNNYTPPSDIIKYYIVK